MAKAEKPKKDGARGRTKAANRSGTQTAANKAARMETRARRFLRAAERRTSDTYTIPMNAMMPPKDLPRKNYDALVKACNEAEIPMPELVPDPRRGTKLRGQRLSEILRRREEQARRINVKQKQRRNFSKLSAKDKREHRDAGIERRAPRAGKS